MFFPVCQSEWQLSGAGARCHRVASWQCAAAVFPLWFLGPYCETVLPLGPPGRDSGEEWREHTDGFGQGHGCSCWVFGMVAWSVERALILTFP